MLLAKPIENLGGLRGTIYDFEDAGDVLPKHMHTEEDVHITVVAKGSVRVYSHDWSVEAVAGQVLNFRAGEPHEIAALEPNTRVVNIIKNCV